MDKKKKISKKWLAVLMLLFAAMSMSAQKVSEVKFCANSYEYGEGKDSITLYLKIIGRNGKRPKDLTLGNINDKLVVKENGKAIDKGRRTVKELNSGQRIPSDYTFSVLIDQSIPIEGKEQIYNVVRKLVESVADSCVYLSFFGDNISRSQVVTKDKYKDFKDKFNTVSEKKYFYGALYSKLAEFSEKSGENDSTAMLEAGYAKDKRIIDRAKRNPDKNILFVFTEGSKTPEEEDYFYYASVTDYQRDNKSHISPVVYSFYYTGNGINEDMELTLKGVAAYENTKVSKDRRGGFCPSDDMGSVMKDFEDVVKDVSYDYAFRYKVNEDQLYAGNVNYTAEWDGWSIGDITYTIGSAESPWPTRTETASDSATKYIVAVLVALLTLAFFFIVAKIIIPMFKSKRFAMKYYNHYVPEENVQRRICHYCRQDIQPGDKVVTRCKHIMHVHCWKQNNYRCAEFGQNCREGIQKHVEWKSMFSKPSLRELYQTFSGILAGLISWVIYELTGRGLFNFLAKPLVSDFLTNEEHYQDLYDTCVAQVSAFLTIGFLLAFFLSLFFRFNDEYRKKNWKIYLKIIGLSLLSAIIGLVAFALGSIIFCVMLSVIGTSYIPWYCSLPAYILFSICTSLSLTIKSTIPLKSALIGGLVSAVIGFFVLYFSSFTSTKWGWMNMLLAFVIYGGGIGASLVTVRMLAEKYFLVIKNGLKEGQRIPIHKWMNATGGGKKVTIGMTGECEIQMNWEKSNKVAKEHVQLFIDHEKSLPMLKPLATNVLYNTRAELPVNKPTVLSNGDTFKIGDTIFEYVETE